MAETKNTHTISEINEHGDLVRKSKGPIKEDPYEWSDIPAEYYNLGWFLVIPLLLGLFVGRYLDKQFGTGSDITMSMIVIGVVSVFYNLYKLYKDGTTHKHTR